MAETPIFIDGFSDFVQGMDSGVAPLLLPKNKLSFAINTTVRGAYATHRPPYRKSTLTYADPSIQSAVEDGLYQGGNYYQPDSGPQQFIAQISGRLFLFTPDPGREIAVTEITIPGDPNPANIAQVWMWQAENYMIVQDGQSIPIFYNGTFSRRSNSTQTTLGTVDGTGFTVPAIGDTVVITLTSLFLGQIGDIFFIDGFSYQATYPAGAANATLTQLFDNVASEPIGTQVVINPNIFGVQATSVTFGNAGTTHAPNTLFVTLTLTQPYTGATGLKVIFFGKIFTIFNTGSTNILIRNDQTFTVPAGMSAGLQISYSGTSFPITNLGTLVAAFTPPGTGNDVDIELTSPYTGTDGETVYVGTTGQYTIAQKASPPPGLTVTAININDTTTGVQHANDLLLSVPELPPGRMGCYGMGRNWMSLTDARSFIGSDIVGGTSGTPANDFRDSVLKTTENTYLAGGGVFRIPSTAGDIQAMIFTATLDTSLGQGPLQVFTQYIVFSVNAPVERAQWQNITNPILTESLISNGALGQNSTVLANGDTIFRSIDGIRSLILARREFATWGNTPISHEMSRVIDLDDVALLNFGSAEIFSNRLLMTSKPTIGSGGTFNRGLIALNFDPLSSIGEKSPSVYDGLWTGLNVLQILHGTFTGIDRSFAFSFNTISSKIEIYELLADEAAIADDNGNIVPITWQIETGCLFVNTKGKGPFDLLKLLDGELYVSEVSGTVRFEVDYRAQFDPCWHPWHSFSICANEEPALARKQNRVMLGLGQPPQKDACDPQNQRSFFVAESFQLRIRITGHCKLYGVVIKASLEPRQFFVRPVCGDHECKLIQCAADDDYGVYSLQDRNLPQQMFFNEQVTFNLNCAEDETLTYDGTLPNWITIDLENNLLVGAAHTFQAPSQAGANAIAQNSLNIFTATAISGDLLTCEPASDICTDGPDLTPTYEIDGYVDGLFANVSGGVLSSPVWDGSFPFSISNPPFASEGWSARSNPPNGIGMDTREACNALLIFDGCIADVAQWVIQIYNANELLWSGLKTGGDTPVGTYDITGGADASPLTVDIVTGPGSATPVPSETSIFCVS